MASDDVLAQEDGRMDPYKALAARLQWVRETQGRGRSQVADALGMTWEGYAGWETGRTRVPIMAIPPLADAFGLSSLELLRLLGLVDDPEAEALVSAFVERRTAQERARVEAAAIPPPFAITSRLGMGFTRKKKAGNRHDRGDEGGLRHRSSLPMVAAGR